MTIDAISPTREWQRKFRHAKPKLDQQTNRVAYRRLNGFASMKCLEPEHRQAAEQLEVHYYGAQGVDVRRDDEIRSASNETPNEFAIHKHQRELQSAKKAVGSPRVWSALIAQISDELSPQGIGHNWAKIKGRQQAKGYGEALIIAGLDTLCIHWGLITRPPD